ncbi:MAG: ketopantoate reductase family protein [Clostridiales bacterium]|nr:ketopantoate reductase family protein [Clostridiales bacterium]
MPDSSRILVFGAGIIGSLYALRFIQTGMDVTLLARGNRLEELRENGLKHSEKGLIKTVPVNLIESLERDDVYDFIFVPVRYDQMPSALMAIQANRSENIVTLANTTGYDEWTSIIGGRLVPGFPGAGGDMKDGVLYGKFGKKVQGTIFGEINGEITKRIEQLASIFESACLPYEISKDILAFHLSHAAFVAAIRNFYAKSGMLDARSAKRRDILRKVATDIKQNVHLLEQAGISILDPKTRIAGKMPSWAVIAVFRLMLSMKFTRSVLLGSHALAAKEEILRIDKFFQEKSFESKLV